MALLQLSFSAACTHSSYLPRLHLIALFWAPDFIHVHLAIPAYVQLISKGLVLFGPFWLVFAHIFSHRMVEIGRHL